MAEQEAKVQEEDAAKNETRMDQGTQAADETSKTEPQPEEDPPAAQVDQTLEASDTESTEEGTISSDPGPPPEDSSEGTISSDPGTYVSDGSEETTDETLTETTEEFAEVVAGRATTTGGDEAEPVEPETAPVTEAEPVADEVVAPEERAAEYKPDPDEEGVEPVSEALPIPNWDVPADEGPGSSNPDPAAEEDSYQDSSGDDRWVEEQPAAPPEVTIGVSAVETLPDESPAQLPESRSIDDMIAQVPREVEDNKIENSDLVKKPYVENKPDPDRFPGAHDGASAASGSETLDIFEVANGDADGTEPTRAASRMSSDDVRLKGEGSTGEVQRVDSSLGATTITRRKADADDDNGADEPQPAPVREVQPTVAASLGNPDQDAPADRDLQAEARLGEDLTMKSLGSDAFVDGPGQTGSFDPVADVAIEGASPPMTGPAIGARVDIAGTATGVDSIVRGDAPGPVSDSSGIQSGEAVSTTNSTDANGDQHQTSTFADGSKVTTTTHTDGSTSVSELSGDKWTHTQTTYDKEGNFKESTTTTTHRDGSEVTETKKADGTVTEEHSDGTVIVYHPDGTTTVTEPKDDNPDDDEPDNDEPDNDEPDDDESDDDEPDDDEPDDDDAGQSTTGGESGSEESASRPGDDYFVDSETLAAMHQAEAEWQQAIRESSTINPVRVEVGTAEGADSPPPGVDDPPEDEAPRSADDLPDDDPGAVGASGGNIDWGPDHVEQNETAGSDHRVTEELGTQSGYGSFEANPADAEDSLTLDPAAIQRQLEEFRQSASGVVPDDVLRFFLPGADVESQSGATVQEEGESLPVSAFETDADENQGAPDDDGM